MAIRSGACFEPVIITVFLVTPPRLLEILHGLGWEIHEAHDVSGVVQFLSTRRAPVVLCHCSFAGESWKDILEHISFLPCPPRLIVTSEIADDVLWAEVLSLGGYDVIAQPFWEPELARTLSSALRRWQEDTERVS